jgi:hypothetical protein
MNKETVRCSVTKDQNMKKALVCVKMLLKNLSGEQENEEKR